MEKLKQNMYTISTGMFALLIHQTYNMIRIPMQASAAHASAAAELQQFTPLLTAISIIGSLLCILMLAILGIKGVSESKHPGRGRFHIILAQIGGAVFTFSGIGAIINLFTTTNLVAGIVELVVIGLYIGGMVLYINRGMKLRAAIK